MPGLVRKLLVFAAVDGLILQPAPPRNHAPSTQQAIKIDYKGNVGPLLKDRREEDTAPQSLEVHGIVGLLKVATSFFLISICGREQVAQIRGKAIYKITDVALIPLSSQSDAESAIASAREHVQRHTKARTSGDLDSETESDYDDTVSAIDSLDGTNTGHGEDAKDSATGQKAFADRRTSVAQDVISKKGVYGRFADKWFSKKGWSAESRRNLGISSEEDLTKSNIPKNVDSTVSDEKDNTAPAAGNDALPAADNQVPDVVSPGEIPKALEGAKDSTTIALLPKILRTTKMYFSSGNFFFSYDYDLSRGIGQQHNHSSLPLYRQSDPLYFWNEHIMSPFIEAGQHSFILPVIQGFVGQRSFSIKAANSQGNSAVIDPESNPDDIQLQSWHDDKAPEPQSSSESETEPAEPPHGKDFLLTLISRRSIKRAGLRYLRRGVDDEGNTANSVETEQILSSSTWDTTADKIFSFTQYRGSIPLFFSQSPYSLKPQVNTWGTPETNAKAFKLHFSNLTSRYGSIYCASLVDKSGNEGKIGEAYERQAKTLNSNGGVDGQGKELGFEWFDFHNVCRGMRFENVSRLMDSLGPFLKSTSWTEISNDRVTKMQSGVLRTNCMDCLDRTNVVQSACGRTALEAQLSEGGVNIDLQNDPSTSWFNTLWADNGDAISRQYAGTAALKGDFTRTRKRQITGALTDFGLTLTRYYNNIVNDYFAQAVIDYILGRATDTIFAEFEADMKSSDHFVDLRKVRQAAIERCEAIVIEDKDEDFIAGWTLSAPATANSLKTATFEEVVLLLTDKALYFCRLDWGTEKVREFERIELEHVDGIARGVYITSTLAQRHMDPDKNVGFVIRYVADPASELVRRNTRSLDSGKRGEPQDRASKNKSDEMGRFLAFKALPPRSSNTASESDNTPVDEARLVKEICEEIIKVAIKARGETTVKPSMSEEESTDGTNATRELTVEEKDIISLADAKKSTSYLEQLGYSLKKLVWA